MLLRSLARRSSVLEAVCRGAGALCQSETQIARILLAAAPNIQFDQPTNSTLHTSSFTNEFFSLPRGLSTSSDKGGGSEKEADPDSAASTSDQAGTGPASQTLMNALDKLVSAAAEFVEDGKLSEAISVLTQGIAVLEGPFPKSTEVGELHSQVALLLLFSDKVEEAEQHTIKALEITQEVFGSTHILTAKRMLRLGVVETALGKTEDAHKLLAIARQILQVDPMKFAVDIAEVDFYTALLKMSAASSPSDVHDLQPDLFASFKILADNLGRESLTVSICLGQQTRTTLNAMDTKFQVAEALFKQEIKLLESSGGQSEAVGLTLYKLATYYYANDLFHDGTEALQKASSILRNALPDNHDLLVLCKHRQGMLCALGGDHRAAAKLLKETQAHFVQLDPHHVLALEAAAGLALARVRELDVLLHGSTKEMNEILERASTLTDLMGQQIGLNHMLVRAVTRRLEQLRYSLEHR